TSRRAIPGAGPPGAGAPRRRPPPHALVDSTTDRPSRVADLLAEAARLDALTLAVRDRIYRARRAP
ncbi:hypothetical protein M3E10_14445, partial [Dietzia cinnamea]|uniref:hypothetical protein n=1 Tax=Dietzia cinnamea TaxID=321318 RepID=UPI0021A33E40